MLHDFAKLSRASSIAGAVPQPPVSKTRKWPKGRWILAVIVIVAVVYWRVVGTHHEPDADFAPGASETREYQQALEQQEQEQREKETREDAARKAEQQRLMADLQEKLKRQATAEPEFVFYDSLSDSAWGVPVQQGIYVTEEQRKQRASQRYMLQAASVRDFAEAQRIVQRLRQVGLQAFYSHDTAGGWYRINVGPFDNVSKMNKAEDILVSLRMMPLKKKL